MSIISTLLIFLISTTPTYFTDDCNDKELGKFGGIHSSNTFTKKSKVTYCNPVSTSIVVHEMGHELHHRMMISDDLTTKYELEIWERINKASRDRYDYVSEYAMKNMYEDFADTFEVTNYRMPIHIQDPRNMAEMKIYYMQYIIARYNKNLDLLK